MQTLYRSSLGLLFALAVSACGASNDDNLCTPLGPTATEGCYNPLYNVGPHPCVGIVEKECAQSSDTSCASSMMTECATFYYLRNYTENELPVCDATYPTLSIDKDLELSLYRYSDIGDAATAKHTKGLQAYYAPNALWMHTHAVAAYDRIRYAISGDNASLNQAIVDAGIPPNAVTLTPDQEAIATTAIGRVMFAPTREFFERHAIPAESKVNVVVIDQIISPEMVTLMGLEGTVVGLGLSPSLLATVAAEDADGQSLNTMLQVAESFTPTLFVGDSDIVRYKVNFQHVVAHEMGHALGLPHVEATDNLMEQGGDVTCRHWLSQEQIDTMGPFADFVSGPDEALARIVNARHTVLRNLMAQRRH